MRTALKTVLDLYSRSIRSTATTDPVIVPFRVQLISTVTSNGLLSSFPLLEKSLPIKTDSPYNPLFHFAFMPSNQMYANSLNQCRQCGKCRKEKNLWICRRG